MWHIDTTVIRLLDGTRAYLHAVIDNFSRRILAWRVADTFASVNSVAVLLEASRGATRSASTPVVLADAGVENVNAQVDELIDTGVLRRLLAFTELKFSNSMIEAWWRSLKHQWLFLHSLESATWCTPSMLVSFKGQLRGVDCWWGRWTVSFCDIALDLGSLENPWCVRAGLCRSQPFQPDQTKDRGGCDAKDDSDFTDRHLATGLTFPLTIDRNRPVVAQRGDTACRPALTVWGTAVLTIEDRRDPCVGFDSRQRAHDLHEIFVRHVPIATGANLRELHLGVIAALPMHHQADGVAFTRGDDLSYGEAQEALLVGRRTVWVVP
jgi:hypothetical protein